MACCQRPDCSKFIHFVYHIFVKGVVGFPVTRFWLKTIQFLQFAAKGIAVVCHKIPVDFSIDINFHIAPGERFQIFERNQIASAAQKVAC